MKSSKKDRAKWLVPAAWLCASIAVAAIMAYAGEKYTGKMALRHQAAERKFSDAAGRLSSVRQERADIDAYDSQYLKLMQKGAVSDFHRLDLVDRIAAINARSMLFDLHYTIAPQRKIVMAPWNAMVNRADFEFQALHEEQLLNFLEALRDGTRGMSVVEGCAIDRANGLQDLSFAPQLKAKCSLAWVTLADQGGAK